MGLTREAAEFVAAIGSTELPEEAVRTVCTGFADCIGVTYAGWNEAPVATLRAAPEREAAHERPFGRDAAAPAHWALVHAAAAHVHDWDDTALSGHPSAVLVPVILAEAASRPAPGRRMVAAYLAGYEVWAELILREPDALHAKGWHPSATIGVPAAAAAVAAMRGFDAARARETLALAASMTGGIVGNFGTPAKCWQLGRAAESGIVAADLAEAGMTGAGDALEHPSGLLAALSPSGRVDLARPARLGRDWAIRDHGLNLKMYPVCYAMHRMLDAASALVAAHAPAPDAVARVIVEIGATQASILRSAAPATALDARFSAEFGIAAMLLADRCGRAELTDAFVSRADVQDLMRRVEIRPLSERMAEDPAHSPWDRVTVELADGTRVVSDKVAHPVGHFRNPPPPRALRDKFGDAAGDVLDEAAADHLFGLLARLDALPGSETLFEALAPGRSHVAA